MTSDAAHRLNATLADRYRIERELGQGGMATVYLARDLKHHRQVAIKVLHPELSAILGPERFLKEIELTANLQHPHILPLFDSGSADGLLYYVMPLVEGETLRTRLERERQLPVSDTVRIASEVADALEYAHKRGVIHRDIKPENILLHHDHCLVADFGIALAVEQAGGARMTQTGLSLGTPQYMSPEQAMGERQVTARSDIYALGAVVYEMLAGEPPFTGPTAQAIVAKVLTEKPVSIRTRRNTVPSSVEQAIFIALQKLPADRFASAKEFAAALNAQAGTAAALVPATLGQRWRGGAAAWHFGSPLTWAVAFGVTALAAAIWGWTRRSIPALPDVVRFTVQPAPGTHLAFPILGMATTVAISPDGRQVVYSAAGAVGDQLYLQSVDKLHPRALPGTGGASYPEFSPDGKWLAFVSTDQTLKKMLVDGDAITTLCLTGPASGLTWISNETLVFAKRTLAEGRGLWRVSADGGEPVQFSSVDTVGGLKMQWAPRSAGDGRLVFYSSIAGSLTDAHIGVTSLETGKSTILQSLSGSFPLGLANGQLLYVRNDGALMAAPFDSRTLRAGAPVQVADSIAISLIIAAAAVSASGSLAYVHRGDMRQLVNVDDHGQAHVLVDERRPYSHPRLSPDGRRLAFDVSRAQGTDIWVYDLAARTLERLTTEGTSDRPEWTPDGTKVLYSSNRKDGRYALWWRAADASTPAELLYAGPNIIREGVVAPDGHEVIYREDSPRTNRDVYRLPLTGERKPIPLLTGPADELMPRVSPDGKWLAYVSDESGQYEVYVRMLSGAGGRVPVSSGGGMEPLWAPDGRRVFYRSGTKLVAAAIATFPALAVTGRQMLFAADFEADPFHPNYDVARDGKSFIMLRSTDDDRQLVIVQNWIRELRERTAQKR